jgi:hypothetical protein
LGPLPQSSKRQLLFGFHLAWAFGLLCLVAS